MPIQEHYGCCNKIAAYVVCLPHQDHAEIYFPFNVTGWPNRRPTGHYGQIHASWDICDYPM